MCGLRGVAVVIIYGQPLLIKCSQRQMHEEQLMCKFTFSTRGPTREGTGVRKMKREVGNQT